MDIFLCKNALPNKNPLCSGSIVFPVHVLSPFDTVMITGQSRWSVEQPAQKLELGQMFVSICISVVHFYEIRIDRRKNEMNGCQDGGRSILVTC